MFNVTSSGNRVGNALAGVVFGVLLFGGSFVLLWWNEGRSVQTYKSLKEGAAIVVDIAVEKVVPENEGKLVHVSGLATTEVKLTDPAFGVADQALRLTRKVEMYQWDEEKKEEKRERSDGSKETITRYTYRKIWSSKLIDSNRFDETQGHENPAQMPFSEEDYFADPSFLGAFRLSEDWIRKMDDPSPLSISQETVDALNAKLPPSGPETSLQMRYSLSGGSIYWAKDSASPRIGDTRVSFTVQKPMDVSIIGRQTGDSFTAYQAKAGDLLEMLDPGTVSAAVMFQKAHAVNEILTWALRVGGFFMMFIGLVLIAGPLNAVASFIPFLGGLVGFASGLAAFMLSAALSLSTIAVAWIFYRPVLGICLLVAAVGALVLMFKAKQQKQAKVAAVAAAA